MLRRRFLVLLVALALSSLLLSGVADSAVRTMASDGTGEVPGGVVFKDGGGDDGGDDDRWGDVSPTIPGEDDPEPEMGSGNAGDDPDEVMRQMFTGGDLWSVQIRFFLSRMLMRF